MSVAVSYLNRIRDVLRRWSIPWTRRSCYPPATHRGCPQEIHPHVVDGPDDHGRRASRLRRLPRFRELPAGPLLGAGEEGMAQRVHRMVRFRRQDRRRRARALPADPQAQALPGLPARRPGPGLGERSRRRLAQGAARPDGRPPQGQGRLRRPDGPAGGHPALEFGDDQDRGQGRAGHQAGGPDAGRRRPGRPEGGRADARRGLDPAVGRAPGSRPGSRSTSSRFRWAGDPWRTCSPGSISSGGATSRRRTRPGSRSPSAPRPTWRTSTRCTRTPPNATTSPRVRSVTSRP